MQIRSVLAAGAGYEYTWPSGNIETYRAWVDFSAVSPDGEHTVRVGFGSRPVWESERERVVVWIDGKPQAEFFGSDDFETSGDVLSDIWLKTDDGEVMCRYPQDAVPERYAALRLEGLPLRVSAKGLRNSWVVVANISDLGSMIALAALRRQERM